MKILVVEDEIGIASFLKQGLEEESYQVAVCHDGEEGLSMANTGEYDLLLLDWMLPNKNGIDICKSFRTHDRKTPIIFLTAKDTVTETIEGLQAGANDYINKPFHFDELLERIKVQLRNKNTLQNELVLGDITINKNSYTVKKSGVEVKLTQKEYDLLLFMTENKDNVCTRTSIIQQVWDIHFDYNTGVIDVYVNSLRKKLQLQPDQLIHTIRGVGYIAKDN